MPFRYFPWGKYLPLDGSKAMTGNLDMDTNKVIFRGGTIPLIIKGMGYGIAVRTLDDSSYQNIYSHRAFLDAINPIVSKVDLTNCRLYTDLDVNYDSVGPLLIDRTTATKYRLYVDNGVLSIEAI